MASPKASRLAFRVAFVCVLGPVYLTVASEGLRAMLPAVFGMKLHKLPLPFVSMLDEYKSGEFVFRLG